MARAIIADDSKFMRRIIRETLEEGGHEIIGEVDNGIDAVEEYKKLKPDFITMDITMWGKDGLNAVNDIISFEPTASIIVISALSEKTLKLSQQTIPAKLFLTKPFEKKQLIEGIKSIL